MSLLLSMLTQTCTINRKYETKSSVNAETLVSWSSVYTGVRCSIQAADGTDDVSAGSEGASTRFRGYFPADTDLTSPDRVLITDGAMVDREFAVTSAPMDKSGVGDHLCFNLSEVEGVLTP